MSFRYLTAGESHGKALSILIEGVPAGLALTEEYIARDLRRRQGGYGRGGRMQIEQDHAEILTGVRHGLALGSPIALLVRNRDWENWKEAMAIEPVEGETKPVTRLRPGHADLPGAMKYNQRDIRNILERSSARETAARVAAGAVARRLLEELDVHIHSHTRAVGQVTAKAQDNIDWERVEASPVRCADQEAEAAMIAAIDAAREDGDTIGGVFEVIAFGVPIGLGSHVQWDRKLDGRIAQAMMSINAVKGVQVGEGFEGVKRRGSQFHDIIEKATAEEGRRFRRRTNTAGGIEGGMSNGEPIVVRCALKPIATLAKPLPSADLVTGEPIQAHYERSDVCVVPAAGVIGEAMLALVLADSVLEKFGGDHIEELLRNYRGYIKSTLE